MPDTIHRPSAVPAPVKLPVWLECSPVPEEGMWVYLLQLPHAWSFEEALLLCQE